MLGRAEPFGITSFCTQVISTSKLASMPCTHNLRNASSRQSTAHQQLTHRSKVHVSCVRQQQPIAHKTKPDAAPTSNIASTWKQALCTTLAAASLLVGSPSMAQDVGVAQRAITEYVELESKGKIGQGPSKALEDFRSKYKIRRGVDGRVQLRSNKGEWFQIRLDMEVPGSMLLRDSKGYVFAIQTEAIQQVDLSDDLVVLMMFADGEWEKQMSAVQYNDEKGGVKQLQLEEKEFREVIGLLKEVEDLEAESQAAR